MKTLPSVEERAKSWYLRRVARKDVNSARPRPAYCDLILFSDPMAGRCLQLPVLPEIDFLARNNSEARCNDGTSASVFPRVCGRSPRSSGMHSLCRQHIDTRSLMAAVINVLCVTECQERRSRT